MSQKNKFIKKAIADATELRESFIKSVKDQLEEQTSARIQSMIANRLNEISDEELEEAFAPEVEETLDETFDFSTFLQEEEDEVAPEPETEETPVEEPTGEETEEVPAGEEQPAGDTKIGDLTYDEFVALIQDVIAGGSDEMTGDIEPEAGIENSDLGSLDAPGSAPVGGDPEIGGGFDDEEDPSLDELLAEMDLQYQGNEQTLNENKKLKDALKEAYETIATIGKTLQDVNLLNSKLIYTNTLIQNKSLTESQQAQVIENIDKATTVKEAKVIFETIQKMLVKPTAKKSVVKESISIASRPTKVAPGAKVDSATIDMVKRMQELAGVIKKNQ